LRPTRAAWLTLSQQTGAEVLRRTRQQELVGKENDCVPLRTITLADAGDGVALEASLASNLLNINIEETGKPLGVDVLS